MIVAEGQIRTAEDRLRTLVMNPSQPDFWTTRLEPSEQPTLTPQPIDVDAAITNALANRTDLARQRKSDRTDRHRPEVLPQPAAAGARRDRGLRPGRHRRHAAAVRPGSGDRRAVRRRSVESRLQRCAARRVRQPVPDLERAAERQLSARPQRGGRGGRAGQAAARSADDRAAGSRDAGGGLGPRGRAAGQHVAEAGRIHARRRASWPNRACRPRRSGWRSACRTRSASSRRSATWRASASTS